MIEVNRNPGSEVSGSLQNRARTGVPAGQLRRGGGCTECWKSTTETAGSWDPESNCGSAAAQCGKAVPFQHLPNFSYEAPPQIGGIASNQFQVTRAVRQSLTALCGGKAAVDLGNRMIPSRIA